MYHYSIGKVVTGRYYAVASLHEHNTNILLPNIRTKSGNSIYCSSLFFSRLICCEVFMDKLPETHMKDISFFDWLYGRQYTLTLKYMREILPSDFKPLYKSLMEEIKCTTR